MLVQLVCFLDLRTNYKILEPLLGYASGVGGVWIKANRFPFPGDESTYMFLASQKRSGGVSVWYSIA